MVLKLFHRQEWYVRKPHSFQMIVKLTQSFLQRFIGGANSPYSKRLTVWYALSHTRRMTAARQKVSIGVVIFGVCICG
jgi:hypothetical protein